MITRNLSLFSTCELDDDGDDGDDDDKRKRDRCLHCSQTPSPCTQCHRHCTKLLRTPISHLFPSLFKKTSHVTCNICIPASESTIVKQISTKTPCKRLGASKILLCRYDWFNIKSLKLFNVNSFQCIGKILTDSY